jgi:hypothetical protein
MNVALADGCYAKVGCRTIRVQAAMEFIAPI